MNPQELESPKTMIRNVCAKQGLATVRMAIRQNSFFMDCSGWDFSKKMLLLRNTPVGVSMSRRTHPWRERRGSGSACECAVRW